MTVPERNRGTHDEPPPGVIIPLDIVPATSHSLTPHAAPPPVNATDRPYSPERQRDWVRLIVTCGLLLILAYIVIWSTIESASYPAHWQQTKELLQIILPALTGIIGTVIGFYFGTAAANGNQSSNDNL